MKIVTCLINTQLSSDYRALIRALENSVKFYNPLATFEVHNLNPKDYPEIRHRDKGILANSIKLNFWNTYIKEQTKDIILIDGDTIVLDDLKTAFKYKFDVGLTYRHPEAALPINGGIIFVRPSSKVFDLFEEWTSVNNRMLIDCDFHRPWLKTHGGINQASLGYLLHNPNKHNVLIKFFEGSTWNACDPPDWINFSNSTKVLHVKSALRQCCLKNLKVKEYQNAINAWRHFYYLSK